MHKQIKEKRGRGLGESKGEHSLWSIKVLKGSWDFYIWVTWWFLTLKPMHTIASFSENFLIFCYRLLKRMFHLRFVSEHIRYQNGL